jgi:hypothetical protein
MTFTDLNCLILGEDPNNIFTVQILCNKTVGDLRRAIKEETKPEFDHVPADTLVLWSVSILVDHQFRQNLDKFVSKEQNPLSPVEVLSDVFPDPLKRHVHVVVQPPPYGHGECHFPFQRFCVFTPLLHSTTNRYTSSQLI